MRCKPGDLAVIYRTDGNGIGRQICDLLLGHVVRVVKLEKPMGGLGVCSVDLVWQFEEPIVLVIEGSKYDCLGIADYCLLPLRGDVDMPAMREQEA